MSHMNDAQEAMRNSLATSKTIALVGASAKENRPSYQVMAYLLAHGYEVIPVNPAMAGKLIQDRLCYGSLHDIAQNIDMVDVFRQSAACLPIAQDAIAIGAKSLWLQIGVINDEAVALAQRAGLFAIQDRCTKIEHEHLFGSKAISQ